jgi:hypothetical protein
LITVVADRLPAFLLLSRHQSAKDSIFLVLRLSITAQVKRWNLWLASSAVTRNCLFRPSGIPSRVFHPGYFQRFFTTLAGVSSDSFELILVYNL